MSKSDRVVLRIAGKMIDTMDHAERQANTIVKLRYDADLRELRIGSLEDRIRNRDIDIADIRSALADANAVIKIRDGSIAYLDRAIANLVKIMRGEGGTERIDPETGLPSTEIDDQLATSDSHEAFVDCMIEIGEESRKEKSCNNCFWTRPILVGSPCVKCNSSTLDMWKAIVHDGLGESR